MKIVIVFFLLAFNLFVLHFQQIVLAKNIGHISQSKANFIYAACISSNGEMSGLLLMWSVHVSDFVEFVRLSVRLFVCQKSIKLNLSVFLHRILIRASLNNTDDRWLKNEWAPKNRIKQKMVAIFAFWLVHCEIKTVSWFPIKRETRRMEVWSKNKNLRIRHFFLSFTKKWDKILKKRQVESTQRKNFLG